MHRSFECFTYKSINDIVSPKIKSIDKERAMALRRTRFILVFTACTLLVCISAVRVGAGGSSVSKRMQVDNSPTPTTPQAIEQVSSFRGGFSASVIAGTLAYVNEGLDLTVLDVSTPQHPVRRGRVTLATTTYAMAVEGTTLYVANAGGLQTVDVSDPNAPRLLSRLDSTEPVTSIQVINGIAYLASDIFQTVDVHDPVHPTVLGQLELSSDFRNVEVVAGRAYIVGAGLQIFDVTDPTNLRLIGSSGTERFNQVQVVNNLAYVGDYDGKIRIFDISNPASPSLKSIWDTQFGGLYQLLIDGTSNLAYILSGAIPDYDAATQFHVFDLSDPLHPVTRESVDVASQLQHIQVQGKLVFITAFQGLTTIDMTNPGAPVRLSTITTLTQPVDIQVAGTFAYVVSFFGDITTINIADPMNPTLHGEYRMPDPANAVRLVGSLAYVADDYHGGLQIIDVSDPDHLRPVGSYLTPGTANDVQVVGNLAYVADESSGLTIIDVSDPAHPTLRGRFPMQEQAYATSVWVAGSTIYLPIRLTDLDQSALLILDASDPANVRMLSSIEINDTLGDLQVADGLAYLSSTHGLQILDVHNPLHPLPVGVYRMSGRDSGIGHVQLQGKLAYLSGYTYFVVVDVSDPTNPYTRTQFTSKESLYNAQVVDNLAFAIGERELRVLRLYPDRFLTQTHTMLPIIVHPELTPTPTGPTVTPCLDGCAPTMTPDEHKPVMVIQVTSTTPRVNDKDLVGGNIYDQYGRSVPNAFVTVTYRYDGMYQGTQCTSTSGENGSWGCALLISSALQGKLITLTAQTTVDGQNVTASIDIIPQGD